MANASAESTRVCSKCGVEKPLSRFSARKRWNNLRRYCKDCANAQSKVLIRKMSPEARYLRERKKKLWQCYRITVDDYHKMLERQGCRCRICRTTNPNSKYGVFHVDHDHATGAIRGLLCSTCNCAIGKLRDDASLLRRAADYLEGIE